VIKALISLGTQHFTLIYTAYLAFPDLGSMLLKETTIKDGGEFNKIQKKEFKKIWVTPDQWQEPLFFNKLTVFSKQRET